MKQKLVSVLVVVLITPLASSANLIQNGSFEAPGFTPNAGNGRWSVSAPSTDITGWTVGGAGNIFVQQTPFDGGPAFNPAQDGTFYVDLSGDGSPHGTIYQDFSTIPETPYSLKFYIGSASTTPSATINVQLMGLNSLQNTTLTPLPPNTNLIWSEETYVFTADSVITRISFVDTSGIDDNGSFIDNVSVAVVPEPAALALVNLCSLFLLRRPHPRRQP